MQQYDPKCTISYLSLVSEFLQHYKGFHSPSGVIKRIGIDYLTDVTDIATTQLMDLCTPLPDGFNQTVFQFKESENRRGTFDVVFYNGKLVNFRAQMFFEGKFAKIKAIRFNTSKLRPVINKIVGVENVHHNISTDTFCCNDFNGLIVAFHQVQGTPSVSTAITDKVYV